MNKPSFYAILPATVRYDSRLSAAEKIFYAEITALSNASGYCHASNAYFAKLYGVEERTVQRWLNTLKKSQYIADVGSVCDSTGKMIGRRITPAVSLPKPPPGASAGGGDKNVAPDKKVTGEGDKNVTHNITREEYIKKNTPNGVLEKKPSGKSRPDSVDEVKAYCQERQNGVDPVVFWNFYEANGWVQGKNKPIRDWKAAVRYWETRDGRQSRKGAGDNERTQSANNGLATRL